MTKLEKVTELRIKLEERNTFEPIHLPCDGGFGYGEGKLNYAPVNGITGYWQFSNCKTSFEASTDFVEKVITDNIRRVNYYFQHLEKFGF